jgi:hypothetical protein
MDYNILMTAKYLEKITHGIVAQMSDAVTVYSGFIMEQK